MIVLLRLAWGHAWRRPLQAVFLILGVAIGVAMIVAIDLANGSAQRAFELGAESVAGKATHQIVGGPSGLDEQVYVALRRQLGYQPSAPVVEDYVVALELDAQPMRLLGVDIFAEGPFRSYLGPESGPGIDEDFLAALLVRPDTVLLSRQVADRYGLDVGSRISVLAGARWQELEIVGLLEPSNDLSRRALDGLLIADIATAQEILSRIGRLDRVDLIAPEGPAGEETLARIRTILPLGARLERPQARSATVDEMTAAFRLNLTALSLLALVVGTFLIYNTVTFSVVQRRTALGSLRAVGMTRRQVFTLIFLESGVLGLLGVGLGLGLGVLLGRGTVQLVTQTVNDLFFIVAVREIDVPAWTLAKGAAGGLGAALIAALLPAYEATSVPPAGALRRSQVEEQVRVLLPWVTGAGVALVSLGVLLLAPEWGLEMAFAGLFSIVLGIALLTPSLTLVLMAGVQRLSGPLGVLGRMAPRDIVRSLSRTAVAIAALIVSVSVIIGVGLMIDSFRRTVEQWLGDTLQADIYVSPPSLGANRVLTSLDPDIVARLANSPDVERSATIREVEVAAYRAGVGVDADNQWLGMVRVAALSADLAGPHRRYRTAVGDWQQTWAAVQAGGVVLNEPMANRFDLGVDDEVILFTDQGRRAFSVVGVAYDFDVQPGLFMDDGVYRRFWDDAGISAIALFVAPGMDVDAKVDELRSTFAPDPACLVGGGQCQGAQLVIRSNRGLRQNALEVFDRTFAITVALRLLATLVAFIGILSTLMSLQMERRREVGVLRANGMTRRQLWHLTLAETGLMGSTAGLIAMPTGLLLAVILIYIINLRSFGWTLQMQLQPQEFLQAFAVALGAALLAGIYPAWRMGRIQPADALRME